MNLNARLFVSRMKHYKLTPQTIATEICVSIQDLCNFISGRKYVPEDCKLKLAMLLKTDPGKLFYED